MRNKEQDIPGTADYNGDALTEHYHNAEMAKLTDSEAEFVPADDEWQQKSKMNQICCIDVILGQILANWNKKWI